MFHFHNGVKSEDNGAKTQILVHKELKEVKYYALIFLIKAMSSIICANLDLFIAFKSNLHTKQCSHMHVKFTI